MQAQNEFEAFRRETTSWWWISRRKLLREAASQVVGGKRRLGCSILAARLISTLTTLRFCEP